ncbi:hypothetical protein [Flagellimonas flava]|uniref:hypothetical protein n=1 Tax=Flagellimonas flava TaxID=570519 RepID=UPI003D648743
MDLIKFLGEKECDQWEMFGEDGEMIGEVKSIDAEYQLYKLYGFFVELTMIPMTEKGKRMMPFVDGPRLEKYQHDI